MQSVSDKAMPTLKTGLAHPHPSPLSRATYSAVELMPDDRTVVLLDQRLLPRRETYEILSNVSQMVSAIATMQVRGAPAIGVAGAYGLVLAAAAADDVRDGSAFLASMRAAAESLRKTRPTATNLAWAVDRVMETVVAASSLAPRERLSSMAAAARAVHAGEVKACEELSALGAARFPAGASRGGSEGATVLTYCNAGALATGGVGTALGVIQAAFLQGKVARVVACETRPLLQGARLTAWELVRAGIPVEVITDSMAASLFAAKEIDHVVVGADRIARNGDVANKIGTYGIACLAHLHGVPFDVAAPWSTVDLACDDGSRIVIEQRADVEVTHVSAGPGEPASLVVAEGARVRNPAFDVTPARFVRAIYTERGTVDPVSEASLAALG